MSPAPPGQPECHCADRGQSHSRKPVPFRVGGRRARGARPEPRISPLWPHRPPSFRPLGPGPLPSGSPSHRRRLAAAPGPTNGARARRQARRAVGQARASGSVTTGKREADKTHVPQGLATAPRPGPQVRRDDSVSPRDLPATRGLAVGRPRRTARLPGPRARGHLSACPSPPVDVLGATFPSPRGLFRSVSGTSRLAPAGPSAQPLRPGTRHSLEGKG